MTPGENKMRSIECRTITGTVASLFEKACIYLPADVASSLRRRNPM